MQTATDAVQAYVAVRDSRVPPAPEVISALEADILAAHERYIHWVAGNLTRGRWVPDRDDLIQERGLALLLSLRRYDAGKGASLLTYASAAVKHRMGAWFAEQAPPMRVPLYRQRKAWRAQRDRRGRAIQLPRYFWIDAQPDDLDGPAFELTDKGPTPSSVVEDADTARILADALATLPERHRRIVRQVYGLDGGERVRQAAIAVEEGVRRQRINQLLARGLELLRANPEVRELLPDVADSPVLEHQVR